MNHSSIEQLTKEALTLSENERAELACTLLQSLEPMEEEGIEAAWDAEVALRVERVRQGTARGRTAEDVLNDIRARYQK